MIGVRVVVDDLAAAAVLAAVLERIEARQLHIGQPITVLSELVDEVRSAVALESLHVRVRAAGVDADRAAEWVTTDEASALLGCDPATVRRRAAAGKLPGAVQRGHGWLIPTTALRKAA